MSTLREDESGIFVLKISGDSFDADLAKVKETEGRRYNPENKTWEFPGDPDVLLKLAFTLEPTMSAELMTRVKDSKAEVTAELLTQLPDDAILSVPWSGPRSWGARAIPGVGQRFLVPKQRSGVAFMAVHPHTILADEMGAGKTAQALSTAYERAWAAEPGDGEWTEDPRVLIIAPNSVTGHWADELAKWADVPASDVSIISGDETKRAAQLAEGKPFIIVNWEKLRLMPELAKIKWFAVIADELHRGKNRKSKQTKALWKLRAPVQIGATGTPIMNDPGDLWAPLKWLRPEQYTSYWKFLANYADTYSGFRGKQVVIGVKNADSLRFELSDKMVRRTKREIHGDIPIPFEPIYRTIQMKPKQLKVYEEALKEFWLEIAAEIPKIAEGEERPEGKVREDFAALVDDPGGLEKIKYMITNPAARLTRLRQIATSPALLGGEDISGKLDAVVETITDAEADRPFVVFAWYKPTVQLMINRLEAKDITAKGFTGDNPRPERESLAKSFQAADYQVIIPTLATGGVGIDLYRSSDPLLAEQDWVPAINKQGIDRCDRKGQTNNVQAQYFRSMDTVETGRLAPKLKLKQGIVETILGA